MTDIKILYKQLSEPSPALLSDISKIDGDILILGVGGKMGPALAKLAKQSVDQAKVNIKIIGVSRFSEPGLKDDLENSGIETYTADLMNEEQLESLPAARNLFYLAGTKFGTTGRESYTWAVNTYLPGRVAEKYERSRIVVFSTGNVYPLTPVLSGGATEENPADPLGEYAQSCLGRERIFQYFSAKNNTPLFIYRLNYANDLSYGVLLDIARAVQEQKPIDLRMGHVNVIWQGDANEMALRALHYCSVPSKIVNITGPETVSIRWVAEEFGRMLGQQPAFIHEEQNTALLSNAAEAYRLFGYPKVPLKQIMYLLVAWIKQGGKVLNKPTLFQERQGKF